VGADAAAIAVDAAYLTAIGKVGRLEDWLAIHAGRSAEVTA
jgi:hypothetical protein